jgi:hypothetical protein
MTTTPITTENAETKKTIAIAAWFDLDIERVTMDLEDARRDLATNLATMASFARQGEIRLANDQRMPTGTDIVKAAREVERLDAEVNRLARALRHLETGKSMFACDWTELSAKS